MAIKYLGENQNKHFETHMKLIPKWAKGISFLEKESSQTLTGQEGKPGGIGAKELWMGKPCTI